MTSFKGTLALCALLCTSWAAAHSLGHADREHVSASTSLNTAELLSVDDLIQRYSHTGNDALLEQAWAQLTPQLSQPTPALWIQAAWLAQAEHAFDRAADYLDQVLAAQPRHAQALLMSAAVATVQSDYARAKAACTQVSLAVAPVVAMACQLRAETDGATKRRLLMRLQQMPLRGLDAATEAWVWSVLGDALMPQSLHQARSAYEQALAKVPAMQTRVALADVLLALGEHQEARRLLQSFRQVPAAGVRDLMAAQQLGVAIETDSVRLDETFRHWIAHDDYRHAREMVMFYLDVVPKAELAYWLAEKNLAMQREPEDVVLFKRAAERVGKHRDGV